MIKTIVVIEDKDGNEFKGETITEFNVKEDQMVTARIYNGKYINGFIVEIKGEVYERPSLKV